MSLPGLLLVAISPPCTSSRAVINNGDESGQYSVKQVKRENLPYPRALESPTSAYDTWRKVALGGVGGSDMHCLSGGTCSTFQK